MKYTLLFFLLIFASLHGKACMCGDSESNFYRNLSTDNSIFLVVMKELSKGNEYNERIEQGNFRVLDVIYDPGNIYYTDSLVIFGSDGLNCGEYLSQFNMGDTLFLTISPSWVDEQNRIYLEGCNENYLKVEKGKCKGLSINEVYQKINNSVGQSLNCGCGMFNYLLDFYRDIDNSTSLCFASFISYDYAVEWEGRSYQTGYFKVLDTIQNFNLPVNSTFTVIGENGINCGEMFNNYEPGDSLVLKLDAPPFDPLSCDTFSLAGYYCGGHALKIINGFDKKHMSYAEIKAKILSNITNIESFKTDEVCIVFPNPFNSDIYVSNLNSIILSVKIFDINGKLIFKDEGLNIHQKEYSLGSMSNGVYLIEITTSNGNYSQKIIKSK